MSELDRALEAVGRVTDTRSEAQKQQHLLVQQLGTISRIRANLGNLIRPEVGSFYSRRLRLNLRQRDTLNEAQDVCSNLIAQIRLEMRKLPNKKRNSGLTKD